MIAAIEQAIISMLRSRWPVFSEGAALNEFDINLDFDDILNTPSVALATEKIGITFPTDACIHLMPVISLYHVFKNVGRPDQRRLGVYPLVTGSMQILTGQHFDLDIDPLQPQGANEIYHEKLKIRGLIGFRSDYQTSFDLDPFDPDSDDAVRLMSESLKYYIGVAGAASDTITYPES